MIRQLIDIFVPEQSGGNYILPTTVLGVSFEQEVVVGTVLLLQGTSITITKVIKESLGDGKGTRQAKLTAALTSLVKQAGPLNKVVTSLPSSLVMFKEVSFPFIDADKIKMVLGYQVESLLPFPLSEACIDFIITKKFADPVRAEVMIAAVQRKYVEEHLKPFIEAQIEVSDVTVDLVGIYNIYLRQKDNETVGNTAYIDFAATATKIIFFVDGQLKQIRTLREGISTQTKELWSKINFTLQAFADENPNDQKIKRVTLFGLKEKDQTSEANAEIAAPCEVFSLAKFLTQAQISTKVADKSLDLLSLATALPLPNGRLFTLQPNHLTVQEQNRMNRQTITALFLTIGIFVLLGVHAFNQIRLMSTELEKSQQEIIKTIKTHFPTIKTKSQRDALDFARREVKNEEKIWSSFSSQTRQSFLKYLYELSTRIDRETLGLHLKKMSFSKNIISLEGSVRSFDAVEQFEHQLRETKLFSHVPDMQKVEFSVQLPLESKGTL